ncbi:MAG: Holliday junction resolvase RuvX [Candidatus Moranbacteria bacterium]|nr:Holliday junction resolvase RuvX [Candidatus Moranbacteria bacterium]
MSIQKPKILTISHILGIDYGRAKIGLAIGDSETRIASAYAVLNNDKNLLQKIAGIIERENISKVIIGVTNLETKFPSRSSVLMDEPRSLGNLVSKSTGVEVEYQDEMFTTKQAHQNLIEKGMKGIKRFDDQEAARLILQGWLDKNQ